MILACLPIRSGSVTSSGHTAGGVHGVNAWCSRSVDVAHVVADQEHSDYAVPRYQYTGRNWYGDL